MVAKKVHVIGDVTERVGDVAENVRNRLGRRDRIREFAGRHDRLGRRDRIRQFTGRCNLYTAAAAAAAG